MSSIEHHITGRTYWRSLEQLAETPGAHAPAEAELPHDGTGGVEVSRRWFMKLMGASLALAGLTLSGCRRWPKEKLAPYSSSPKDRIPGLTEQYATVMELGGIGHGLLVTAFDGRPIKIEGNPSHPFSRITASFGAADAFAQASVLELYDPERSRSPIARLADRPAPSTWDEFAKFASEHFGALRGSRGDGLAILCEPARGPSMSAMRKRIAEVYPQARWYEYEPLSRDNELTGAKLAFGRAAISRLHLDQAAFIVSFDADILGSHPAHVRHAADWAERRRDADAGSMNRMYVIESTLSPTGSVADDRLPTRAVRVEALLVALAAKVGITGISSPALSLDETKFIDAIAHDLAAHRGESLVVAGPSVSPAGHALAHAINLAIGAIGKTVTLLEDPSGDRPTHLEAIAALVNKLNAGQVRTLLILGGNPLFDAPADAKFSTAIAKTPMSIHLSLHHNETSAACRWHLPRAHYLEAWGDARAIDGAISVAQPLIEPLFGGRSIIEVLAMIAGDSVTDGQEIVRRTIAPMLGAGDLQKAYRRVLHEGILPASAYAAFAPQAAAASAPAAPASTGQFELRFLPDHSMHDGRFANNGWLQELPDVLTKLVWDNAALISVQDAAASGLTTGDYLRLTVNQRSLEIPAYVLPGQPIGVIGLPLGYGRTDVGNIGNNVGFNVYALRTSSAFYVVPGATIQKLPRKYDFAMTQDHHQIDSVGMAGREARIGAKGQSGPIFREATLQEYQADKDFVHRHEERRVSLPLYDAPHKFTEPHAWAMTVDLNSCIGCNACVVACQSENNIPIVGKDQVQKSREMHWIRIDRYFKGDASDPNPEVVFQPVMCQHCENAPCEQVCPVGATMHDTEGLNAMAYNRCVGTRYCSNNCPYKVRRFNYLDFHSKDPRGGPKPWLGMPDQQQLQTIDRIKRMVFNPDVTVRMRGVMEKCTYCVQRIHAVQIDKRNNKQLLRDGDIITACQQSCPTQAIIFGDLNDPNSRVSRFHRNSRAYELLDDLNTAARTRYLAKLRNPASEPGEPKHEAHNHKTT